MKALQYGWTLILGLSLSVCVGAPSFAQSSGQSQAVTPQNPNPLPEVPAAGAATQGAPRAEYQDVLRHPMEIDNLIGRGQYTEAVAELDKFVKSGQGDVCHRLMIAYQVYASLVDLDADQAAGYAQKRDAVKAEMEKKCANKAVVYIMKAQESQGQPEAVVTWMNKAIEVEPELEFCYELRGNALWQLGRAKEACDDFKKGAETGHPVLSSLYGTYCRAFMDEATPAE